MSASGHTRDPIRFATPLRRPFSHGSELDYTPSLTFRTEVPLPIDNDERAWDGVVGGLRGPREGQGSLPTEAETRIHDVQAQFRRIELKARDSGFEHVIVVIADTAANRAAIKAAAAILADRFPVTARRALAALGRGGHPGGSALVFL